VIPIDSKLPGVGTNIFTVMTGLAEQHGAINLSQGFPDFQPPPELVDRLHHHLQRGRNQYAPMAGVPALREAIAERLHETYDVAANPGTQITITAGATEALFCAIQAVVRPGDEVIVFDPAYDAYEPAVTLAGGRTVHVPLTVPEFAMDWERVADAISPRTRLLIINSPHNPTGALLTREDMDRLAGLLASTNCLVLSDEVYDGMVFDGRRHASILAHPELRARGIAVFSFGKSCHATGWKIGYAVAPQALTTELRRVHQYVTFAVNTPVQHALADHLREHPAHYRTLATFYQARRDEFRRLLADSRLRLLPSHGTYFQLADYSAISDLADTGFARWLTVEHGVAVIPISVFFVSPSQTRLVRLCFAKTSATLKQAAERLCAI
jgi:methionine transaminase